MSIQYLSRRRSVQINEMPEYKEKEVKDPFCDPDNPKQVPFEKISAAAYRIRDGVLRTPCDLSHLSDEMEMKVYLKKDFMQYTGSFKERGARFVLTTLDDKQRKTGVISASAGNHAQAMAYHGGLLGIPVTVVMPVIAPIMKIENCKKYGANVIIYGQNMLEAKQHALNLSKSEGLLYVNGFDHPDILAGQGTMGLEILEQVPNVDAIVVPVGGGGLLAGMAVAIKTMKPSVQIIGVEPELCPSFSWAMKHGKPVHSPCEPSLADGLTVPIVGYNSYATAAPYVDKMVAVSEEWIAISILRLVEIEKAVVEGAGASGVAALLAGLLPELRGKTVVIPLCGGNIDTTILGRCLERGLAADGRLVKFSVTVSDRPGGIAELARVLCMSGVSIKDIVHERAWIKNDIFSVEVKVMAETRNRYHTKQMFKDLRMKYKTVRVDGMDEDLHEPWNSQTNLSSTSVTESSSVENQDSGTIQGIFSELASADESSTDDEVETPAANKDDVYDEVDSGINGNQSKSSTSSSKNSSLELSVPKIVLNSIDKKNRDELKKKISSRRHE